MVIRWLFSSCDMFRHMLDTCLLLLLELLYVIHKFKCLLIHSLHHSFNKWLVSNPCVLLNNTW